jgi:DNA-binding transcriptional MerR regulator
MPAELPSIPAKRYFTIGEVSELCGVKAHVLRYWEQEFTQLRPVKRRGNRRYYQHHEVLLVRRIRQLLYEDGFTISGARNRLSGDATGEPGLVAQGRVRTLASRSRTLPSLGDQASAAGPASPDSLDGVVAAAAAPASASAPVPEASPADSPADSLSESPSDSQASAWGPANHADASSARVRQADDRVDAGSSPREDAVGPAAQKALAKPAELPLRADDLALRDELLAIRALLDV